MTSSSSFLPLSAPEVAGVRAQIAQLGKEIALAKAKIAGLEAGITSRLQTKARLEAKLAMNASPASQTVAMR